MSSQHIEQIKALVQEHEGVLSEDSYLHAHTNMLATYQQDTGSDTLAAAHMDVCLKLAAATCLEQLAAYYASEENSTLQADTVDHGSKSDRYRRLANAYRSQYEKTVLAEKEQQTAESQAAGCKVQLPMRRRLVR